MISQYKIIIGIDTGTYTGLAVWNKPEHRFLEISSMKIHLAFDKVLEYFKLYGNELFVRMEDARLRSWFNDKSIESLQGAGSIKRDCAIWEDFLLHHKIPFASIAPRRGLTKLPADKFKTLTKWPGLTNEHSRDAAMLVYGY